MQQVLVVGGSGYLGQFLVHDLQKEFEVTYTYNKAPLKHLCNPAVGIKVDNVTGEGWDELARVVVKPLAVINCAALSQPAVCEEQPDLARCVNVPSHLLKWLSQLNPDESQTAPLLIHLSTDQVYDGSRSMWKEDDPAEPVNVYGRTKLEAEEEIKRSWPRHVILRSSIIVGPQPPEPLPRTPFIQFVDSALASQQHTKFAVDEFRCPIFVGDIMTVVRRLLKSCKCSTAWSPCTYNLGGPDRLSRMDMALLVAAYRGFSVDLLVPVHSSDIPRAVASPLDISMDSTSIAKNLDFQATSLKDALHHILI